MSTRRTFLRYLGVAAAANIQIAKAKAKPNETGPTAQPNKAGVLHSLDPTQVTLRGEFGRRVDQIIDANILKIDVDETFLVHFRKRRIGGKIDDYIGLGKFIDAVVQLAVGSGDARLIALKKKVIDGLLATQDPDGYVGIFQNPEDRMKLLWDLHESSYLIWALVADYQFFGAKSSLNGARRMANYVLARLNAAPRLRDEPLNPGMPFSVTSIGLDRALLALSDATGEAKYLNFVVDTLKLNEFKPEIRTGFTLKNHVYACVSHCQAQLDLYRRTGDPQLLRATRRAITFLRKGEGLLVTGSCSEDECWHDTQSGLATTSETCASAYLARILSTMLQLEGDSLYGDILERNIYNALFGATAPDGSQSRYFTPFEGQRIYDLFGFRFCCANNNKRALAELRGWLYYRTTSGVAVNLYNASTARIDLSPHTTLIIEQQTDYPSSGDVLLKIDPSRAAHFEVRLRIPRWCEAAMVCVNGGAPETVAGGRFHVLERQWRAGDTIELKMPMPWRFIRGRRSQVGRVAVLRGPVIFTFNPDRNPALNGQADFDLRLVGIDPLKAQPPARDDSVRPGGIACTVMARPPERQLLPGVKPVPMVLSEFPDPNGRAIYFPVKSLDSSALTEDELIDVAQRAV